MHRRGFEYRRLAGEQPVLPARLSEQNAPGETKFATTGVGPHFTAGGCYRHLQSPAAAEERHAGGNPIPVDAATLERIFRAAVEGRLGTVGSAA